MSNKLVSRNTRKAIRNVTKDKESIVKLIGSALVNLVLMIGVAVVALKASNKALEPLERSVSD